MAGCGNLVWLWTFCAVSFRCFHGNAGSLLDDFLEAKAITNPDIELIETYDP
jgi:hypothetical protein